MLISALIAASFTVGCGVYVDEDYVREAEFVGVVTALPNNRGLVRVNQVYSSVGEHFPGDTLEIEYDYSGAHIWTLIRDVEAHSSDVFWEAGWYSGAIQEDAEFADCYVSIAMQPGVTYLLVLNDEGPRRRSVEPILLPEEDRWVAQVREWLD